VARLKPRQSTKQAVKKAPAAGCDPKINRSEKSKKFVLESRRNVVISELSKTTKPKSK
jgi:hypothetical protein